MSVIPFRRPCPQVVQAPAPRAVIPVLIAYQPIEAVAPSVEPSTNGPGSAGVIVWVFFSLCGALGIGIGVGLSLTFKALLP